MSRQKKLDKMDVIELAAEKPKPEFSFKEGRTTGRIIFEIEGVPFEVAKEALRLAAQKLPVTTKFVVRHDYDKNA